MTIYESAYFVQDVLDTTMTDPEAAHPQQPQAPTDAQLEAGRAQWWISTIIANAAALRDAGVTDVKVGNFAATLLPKEPPAPKYDDVKNDDIPDGLPALEDPRTYPGGVVPGFKIEKFDPEEI